MRIFFLKHVAVDGGATLLEMGLVMEWLLDLDDLLVLPRHGVELVLLELVPTALLLCALFGSRYFLHNGFDLVTPFVSDFGILQRLVYSRKLLALIWRRAFHLL